MSALLGGGFMRTRLAFVLSVSFISVGVFAADPLPRAKPETVGMSSERLARIGEALRGDVEKGRLPGAVVAVARKGKLVYYQSFGYLDKDAGTKMQNDAIFSVASMTKPMVAVGALTLLERGQLAIDEPVGTYLPPLSKMQVAVLKANDGGAGFATGAAGARAARARGAGRHLPAAALEDAGRGAEGERRRRRIRHGGGAAPGHDPGPDAPHLRDHLRRSRRDPGAQALPRLLERCRNRDDGQGVHRQARLAAPAPSTRFLQRS